MAYGIIVKNRQGATVVGTKNLSLKLVQTGYTLPAYQTGASVGDGFFNLSVLAYPSGVTSQNAYIFARPDPVVVGDYDTEDTVRHKSVYTFGLVMNASGWLFAAPSKDEVQSSTTVDPKEFNTSNVVWNSDSTGKGRIYYEIWTVGNTDEESSNEGLLIKDGSDDILYSSNRKVFRPESIVYTPGSSGRPRITVSGMTVGYTGSYEIYMDDTSNAAQRKYLAFMNGTASPSSITFGQDVTGGGVDIPIDGKAVFHPMTRWYFYDHNDIYLRKPYVQYIARRAQTLNHTSSTYDGQIRHARQLGLPCLGMIGVTK